MKRTTNNREKETCKKLNRTALGVDQNELPQTVLQKYDMKNTLEHAENKTIET